MARLIMPFVLLILACAVVVYWKFFLIVAAVIVAWLVFLTACEESERRAKARKAAEAALIEHADREHRLIQQGDMDGIYGEYPVPDECRGMGIWLCDDTKQTARRGGPLRDGAGFAG